ncbi:hypothetical protein PR202_ga02335 [Eleusine coracana subsp. coracana]|uniref:Uncharacterized protein n=1 Tax=Eleusine coracana subsp. coracana TaxID=191504 RepID=A0AAV5BLZ7_ELECO|nr:hypothetical protein PR202_ga02335 [Eleusine coracana subsp. coracana]
MPRSRGCRRRLPGSTPSLEKAVRVCWPKSPESLEAADRWSHESQPRGRSGSMPRRSHRSSRDLPTLGCSCRSYEAGVRVRGLPTGWSSESLRIASGSSYMLSGGAPESTRAASRVLLTCFRVVA